MEEVNGLIEEKGITGDKGEEIILNNGQPARSFYSDCTYTYIAPSGRCWPNWVEDRRRYVRRLGCAPWRTGLLLTSTYGQACYEERGLQTLSNAPTVKDLTWLLFYVPPDLEFHLGRAHAVCCHIHRMLKLGHCSIDDDDEELGDDGDQGFKRRAVGGSRSNSTNAPNHLVLAHF